MATQIEALKKRREQLDSKLRELAAKEAQRTSQLDKRRKIIIGGWIMKHRADLAQQIVDNGLEREQDRKAFADWVHSRSHDPSAAQAEVCGDGAAFVADV